MLQNLSEIEINFNGKNLTVRFEEDQELYFSGISAQSVKDSDGFEWAHYLSENALDEIERMVVAQMQK